MVMTPNDAATIIINLVVGIVIAAFGTSPLTTLLVGFLKKVTALDKISPQTLTFVVSAVLWISVSVGGLLGHETEVKNFVGLLGTVLPPIVAFITNLYGAPAIYEAAKKVNAPVIGVSSSASRKAAQHIKF
jgi:CBS domain containing-hemolysin-like protein